MAIRIGKSQEIPEESSMSFEIEAEKERIMDGDIKSLKEIVDQNKEIADVENYELFKKDSSFKLLYASAINCSE